PKSPFIQKFISDRSIHGDAGEELPSNLVGQTGTAETRLYSCGKIRVGNRILDAITAGEGIEKGAPVKIVHVEGIKIVVQEILKS
ncbi:MAG: NfeD family protein, partial [Verrucomicrobia bacterium]|nr:NfeD family protein [Verrucomicrobiota bacterium]